MSANEVNRHLDATTSSQLEAVGLSDAPSSNPHDIYRLDVDAVRLLLSGGSVVDWRRLSFTRRDQVIGFLAVNGFDVHNALEMRRLQDLHRRSVAYVEETFDVRISQPVRHPKDICDVFLLASSGEPEHQQSACVVAKVMHVINHLEARRLNYHLSVSERALFDAAAHKVDETIHRMRQEGLGIARYEPSTKTEHSLYTKLISKPRVTAAQIFDKLRFRLVTYEREDLIDVMIWLTRNLFPFNHLITGESHNTILGPDEVHAALDARCVDPEAARGSDEGRGPAAPNPATDRNFQMVNFVVELPVRIRRVCSLEDCRRFEHLGHLVLVTQEFQLFDLATSESNEVGPANHASYKVRQLAVVGGRLWGGAGPELKD